MTTNTTSDPTVDIAVIGAGIAGMSAAAEIARFASVVVLEAEAQPGYHATGRSAAYFAPAYGNAVVRGLSAASQSFYEQQPAGFSDAPLLHPRNAIHIAPAGHRARMAKSAKKIDTLQAITTQQALTAVPLLNPAYVDSALEERGGGDLNVDAILQGFRRQLHRLGGRVLTNAGVSHIERHSEGFTLTTAAEPVSAKIVVNAAGAWADQVAGLAGLAPLGLTPKRRTALLIPVPDNLDSSDWPMIINAVEPLYCKPDAGALLLSPMDETPSEPCDAAPEELDIAEAIARFEACTTARVQRVTHKWSGLRTFAPDDTFVVGFEPAEPDFFWLAGQGGYGVQTAPALSRLAAGLIGKRLGLEIDMKGAEWGFVSEIAPNRLR